MTDLTRAPENQETFFKKIVNRSEWNYDRWRNNRKISSLAKQVSAHPSSNGSEPAVIFFKASTGILHFSLNSAFHLLTAWSLKLKGVPIVHFTCNAGMSQCVLGTNRDDPGTKPPCRECVQQSRQRQVEGDMRWFPYTEDRQLADALQNLDTSSLMTFEYNGVPLGELVTPSLRWILRRHHLPDHANLRTLLREYILSAWNVLGEFTQLLDDTNPQAVVVFNGMFYPEATARWVARTRDIRVITHEVGLQPISAFFTDGEATAYPIHIPDDFELSPQQNAKLDAYLESRFRGDFTMAGIRFWPEMQSLDEASRLEPGNFSQVVPVFTNVIFDTSQTHANTVFPHMFAWLDHVLEIARHHLETLFIIRAHPDEMRVGKQSRESVQDWAKNNHVQSLPNVAFVGPNEYLSSYEMIQDAKFIMVYNSSIGLEAALMGKPVLCAGKARYTQYPMVFFPDTIQEFKEQAVEFLTADQITVPEEFQRNARRFIYYQLFRTSLPFDEYLETTSHPGFVRLKDFEWHKLHPENSPTMNTIVNGALNGGSFLLND
jgi:hypothetical protein